MPLITRSGKGSPLTITEMDGNFTYLEGLSGGGDTNKREVVFELLTELQYLTSGALTIGKTYIVSSFEFGDDFSNVGYVSEGVPFIATNTTPTTWVNNSVLYEIPNIIEYKIYKNSFEGLDFKVALNDNNYPFIYITFSNFTETHIGVQGIYYDDGFYRIDNSNLLINFTTYDDGVIGTTSTDYLV